MNSIYNVLLNAAWEWIKNRFKFLRIKAYPDRTLLLQIVESDDVDTAFTLSLKAIHINSLVLAARSPFFLKLFSNGMRESEKKNVIMRIEQIEEVSFMDLLKYIHSNNLPTTLNALVDLLVIADKFEVVSCMRDCTRSLQKLPMTCESASVYLDLPPTLLASPTVEPLIDMAKQFLIAKFKDLHKFKDEGINLSLKGIQAVIFSDDLQVDSEYEVYVEVLEWARKHYPDTGERKEILKTHLLHLVRFPFMTIKQLTEEVLTCNDIDPELATHIVIRALSFKAETPGRKRFLAAEECNAASRQFVERAYKSRRIKVNVVTLESPPQKILIYLDFTREELKRVFPDDSVLSETFRFGALKLTFIGRCYLGESSTIHNFWLGLYTRGSSKYTLEYNVALRKNKYGEFQFWHQGSNRVTESTGTTYFGSAPWTGFIGDDSTYFIDDVLCFKVEITIKK